MAGYVKRPVGQEYVSKKLSGATAIKQGAFLNDDIANNEYDIPAANALDKVVFVANEVDFLVSSNQDDSLFEVAGGGLIKGKPIIETEEFITDQIGTTYASIAVGNELGIGVGGKLFNATDLSVANFTTFKTTFKVLAKVKLATRDALHVVANVK